MNQSKNMLDNWLHEDKLKCSEELGDLVKTMDPNMALKIYIRPRLHQKWLQHLLSIGSLIRLVSQVSCQSSFLLMGVRKVID